MSWDETEGSDVEGFLSGRACGRIAWPGALRRRDVSIHRDRDRLVDWSHRFGTLAVEARGDARLPLYENGHGYKAPITVHYRLGPGMAFETTEVTLAFAGQYQTIAR